MEHMFQDLATFPQTTTSPVRITLVDDLETLGPKRAEWNALVDRSQTASVFQTYEWHVSWWKAFAELGRPLILTAEINGRLAGIAPLMVCRKRLWGRTRKIVEFIGAGASDYCDFIVDPDRTDVIHHLLLWLAHNGRLWDVLHLSDIPNTACVLTPLTELFPLLGYPTDSRVLYESLTRLFDDPEADQQIVKKKSLRRHTNYFQRNGHLEFRHCQSIREILGYLDAFFDQHIERRNRTDTPSLFLDPRQRKFYRETACTLGPTGWLRFAVVLFDGRPIAFHFGFEHKDRFIWYKPTFEMEFAKHSPGEVLIKYLLEYALDRGLSEFDFTIGEEAFKYRFANHTRWNYAVRVFRHKTPYCLQRAWLDAKAVIKKSPHLARLGRSLMRKVLPPKAGTS